MRKPRSILTDSARRGVTHPRWLLAAVTAALVAAAALLAVGASLRWIRDAMRGAGFSEDPTPVALRLGDEALSIPANMIRFADQRRDHAPTRVDLHVLWPELEGYSAVNSSAFADGTSDRIVHLSLRPRDATLDEAARLRAVYGKLFAGEPSAGPEGLVVRRLGVGSGYDGEEVYYQPDAAAPFVARCLAEDGRGLPLTCLREVQAGTGLSVTQRFPKALIGQWRALDARLGALVERFRRRQDGSRP